jgi:two-component system cell cycle sensor histidine kinase/response regulator CckA
MSPFASAGSTREAAILYVVDATEQKALEAKFAQSQKMDVVGKLAGFVAHDFNNMLTAIIGFSDMLLTMHRPKDLAYKDIMNIKSSANRAAGLVSKLLALARQQTLQNEVLQMSEVITDLSPLLKRSIGEKIELKIVPASNLWYVKTDKLQLEQAIINLAVNARDAMPRGGRLRIETAQVRLQQWAPFHDEQAAPGMYILLTVSDTGVGMDPQTLLHLFEPFFTTKEPGKGTGLGLATVYGIVRQHGGYISVESELGQGATFKIHLPQVETPVQADQLPPGVSQAPQGSETVLVVEDEAHVRALVRDALESYGYTVLEAGRPQESLRIAQAHGGPIHLLLTDVVMPEMNGVELAERLVAIHAETKVLYMTGYPDEALGQHGVLTENIAILFKPFTPDALAHSVRNALDV